MLQIHKMEWKVIQGNIAPFMLWLLILSTIFLLSSLYSSKPFESLTVIENLNQSLTPNESHNHSLVGSEEVCDYSNGKWIRDTRGALYSNWSCPTMPEIKNCVKYGKDPEYINWRWKPDQCELPLFDGKLFLNIVRGKTLAFVGDSLARNQMESLLCLLSQVETPESTYKDDKEQFQIWYFPSHNFTLRVIWTEFLVVGIERVINGTPSSAFNIHLDKSNPEWTSILPKVQYLVISCGNWFFRKNYLYKSGNPIGCVRCRDANLTKLEIRFAIRNVFRTAFESISKCENCEGLLTVLKTFTTSHFEGGTWFTGGYCNRTQPLSDSENIGVDGEYWDIEKIQVEEMERVRNKTDRTKNRFALLDVTKAMMVRADAHPGSNWHKRWNKHVNDCLHWCLPGPVDMWNDLLLEILKKRSLV